MSTTTEVTPNLSRPSRGSSSTGPTRARGRGRGASSRGGYNKPTESTDWASAQDEPESSEEIAELKSKYGDQLKSLKEIFSDWTTEDLLYALAEVNGDVELATDRITSGILLLRRD